VFLDTGYVITLEAADDQHHAAAVPTKIPGQLLPSFIEKLGNPPKNERIPHVLRTLVRLGLLMVRFEPRDRKRRKHET
jgi:hypothetical protein